MKSKDQFGMLGDETGAERVDTTREGPGIAEQPETASQDASMPATTQARRNSHREGRRTLVRRALIAIVLAGIVAGIVFIFPRLDTYLLSRADSVLEEEARIAAELAEDGFEPIADRVIEDVRSNIYRSKSGDEKATKTSTGSVSDTSVVSNTEGNSSASVTVEQEIEASSSNEVVIKTPKEDLELDPFGLLFLMREAVIAYDDAGEYARNGRYHTAYSYLTEAETLFQELEALIDEGSHTLSGVERRGAEHLRVSAEHFLSATQGAKQFVQGIEPDVDIAVEDERARTELREARALLES